MESQSFKRQKLDDIQNPGKAKILYTASSQDFHITVRDSGIIFGGNLDITNNDDLQDFAYWLSRAWNDHTDMKKAVRKSLMI